MSSGGGYSGGTRVYVGGLDEEIKKEDLEKEFIRYGKLTSVWVAFNPPGFAFVEFENKEEAENACDGLNGKEMLGSKLRVEISRRRDRGGRRGSGGFRGGFRGGSGGGGGGGGYRGGSGGYRGGGGGGFRSDSYGSGRGRGGFDRDSYGSGGRDNFKGRSNYGSRDSYNNEGGGFPNGRYRSRSPVARARY